ncbi:FtsQ-type POTRA domain-containing protein [Cryobacterium glaciale]|uniref:FtsQ-type POTRA domain-containing protein n=1 Tax=Cryobacterium glaciale TaxID=1259145 RepID=A0A4R8US76_9MICO|nr:FtsQ-type POTRA domain-containing protein [Cryobacterium glaciale]TFB69696.1 FtsQ-type POTRA domain-containing protein [Cryobacterium glaciale]
MRRPAGFDRPARPTPEPAPTPKPAAKAPRAKPTTAASDAAAPVRPPKKTTPAPSKPTGRRRGTADRARTPKAFDPSDTTTEPIVLAGGGASASPITMVPTSAAARARPDKPDEPSGGTAGARAARSVLRAAQRARKRFERAEVRRFTGRARRRRTAWILGLSSIVLAFGFIIGAAYSPLMALRTIEVVGTSRIPATDVSAALADQLGTPLPLVDADVVKGALSQFTLIQSYVTESRPPGTLVVRIIERVPVGVLAGPTGFDLVDAAGVVIETTPERTVGYPLIDAPDGIDSAGFKAAAAVLAVLPDGIRAQLDTVTAVTTDDVTLSLLGGERVVWGSPEKSEYKAVVLAALLVGHPAGTVNEYDVSSPDSAVLR